MIVGAIQARPPETTMQRKLPANQQTPDDASEALDRLANFAESAAHSRKAFAEERLKQIKEQMAKLMLFDMAPGALAGQSAQLAKELAAAASDFAGSFKALERFRQPATDGLSLAQQAYLGIGDTGMGFAANTSFSDADHETASRFVSTAEQIASLAEKAAGGLNPRDAASRLAAGARDAASGIIGLMKELRETSASQSFYW